MLLLLTLPPTGPLTAVNAIHTLHAAPGALLGLGSKLLDFSVDLGGGIPQDCPPISHYRIILRDRAWLRCWHRAPGDRVERGAPLALFSTEADESLDRPPARAARVTVAGVLIHDGWA